MGVAFDKLSFMRRLEDAGAFTRPQAEALSEAFHQAVSESVATKQDLGEVRHELAELRTELRSGLTEVRSEIKTSIAETKVWSVSVGATIVAVLATMKYFG